VPISFREIAPTVRHCSDGFAKVFNATIADRERQKKEGRFWVLGEQLWNELSRPQLPLHRASSDAIDTGSNSTEFSMLDGGLDFLGRGPHTCDEVPIAVVDSDCASPDFRVLSFKGD
jgi:hypothetical protein